MRDLPKADPKEGVYSEWDAEYEVWGVFGLDTGFCYGQHYSEEDAKEQMWKLNGIRGLLPRCAHCKDAYPKEKLYSHTEHKFHCKPQQVMICAACADYWYEQECRAEAYMEDAENFIRYRE